MEIRIELRRARCGPDRSGPKPARDRMDRCPRENRCHLPRRSDRRSEARRVMNCNRVQQTERVRCGTWNTLGANRRSPRLRWVQRTHRIEFQQSGDSERLRHPGASQTCRRVASHARTGSLRLPGAARRRQGKLPGNLLRRSARFRAAATARIAPELRTLRWRTADRSNAHASGQCEDRNSSACTRRHDFFARRSRSSISARTA